MVGYVSINGGVKFEIGNFYCIYCFVGWMCKLWIIYFYSNKYRWNCWVYFWVEGCWRGFDYDELGFEVVLGGICLCNCI